MILVTIFTPPQESTKLENAKGELEVSERLASNDEKKHALFRYRSHPGNTGAK